MANTELNAIARRLGLATLDSTNLEPRDEERRQPASRCAGCSTTGAQLIFMSNGGDYCLSCARGLAETFGYGPVGMRADDITTLD